MIFWLKTWSLLVILGQIGLPHRPLTCLAPHEQFVDVLWRRFRFLVFYLLFLMLESMATRGFDCIAIRWRGTGRTEK